MSKGTFETMKLNFSFIYSRVDPYRFALLKMKQQHGRSALQVNSVDLKTPLYPDDEGID